MHRDNFVASTQSFADIENRLGGTYLDAKIEALLNDSTAINYVDKAIKEYDAIAIVDGLKAYEDGALTQAEEEMLLQQMTAALNDNDIMLELFIRSPETEEKMHHFIAAHAKQAELSKSLARGVEQDEDLDRSW